MSDQQEPTKQPTRPDTAKVWDREVGDEQEYLDWIVAADVYMTYLTERVLPVLRRCYDPLRGAGTFRELTSELGHLINELEGET